MMTTAMIAGATGLVGRACLAGLLEQASVDKVITLGRRTLSITSPKLQQQVVHFEGLSQQRLGLPRADVAFCCLGSTIKAAGSKEAFRKVDAEYVHEFAKLALKQGCQYFLLVSSMGADKRSLFFYSRVKGEAEELVQAVGFQGVYIFRPSLLLGSRTDERPLEALAQKASKALAIPMRGPLEKYRPIAAETVAKAMVKAALKPTPGVHILSSADIARF